MLGRNTEQHVDMIGPQMPLRFRRKVYMKTSGIITFCYLRSQRIELLRRRLGRVANDHQLSFANGVHHFHAGDGSVRTQREALNFLLWCHREEQRGMQGRGRSYVVSTL
jgi:hypothetical protein